MDLLTEYCKSSDAKCPKCGYSLTGLTTGVCPECGAMLSVRLAHTAPSRATVVMALLLLVGSMGPWALILFLLWSNGSRGFGGTVVAGAISLAVAISAIVGWLVRRARDRERAAAFVVVFTLWHGAMSGMFLLLVTLGWLWEMGVYR